MVTVPPGPPASLRAARPGQLENLAASDSASDDRGRQLLSGLVLEFADANGVPCSKLSLRGISGDQGGALGQPPPPPPVRCRIVADAGAEEDGDYDERGAGGSKAGRVEEVPRLEGADALGWVEAGDAEWSAEGNRQAFAALAVEADSECADGRYALEFALPSSDEVDESGAVAGGAWGPLRAAARLLVCGLELSTDAARLAAEREARERRGRLEEEVEPLRNELAEMEAKLDGLKVSPPPPHFPRPFSKAIFSLKRREQEATRGLAYSNSSHLESGWVFWSRWGVLVGPPQFFFCFGCLVAPLSLGPTTTPHFNGQRHRRP